MPKNPTIDKSNVNLPGVMDGVDPLPNAGGINQKALSEANKMPAVNMTPNNGTNRDVASPAFATGKDNRVYGSSPKSNPTPGMPGA